VPTYTINIIICIILPYRILIYKFKFFTDAVTNWNYVASTQRCTGVGNWSAFAQFRLNPCTLPCYVRLVFFSVNVKIFHSNWKKLEYTWKQGFQDNVYNYETESDRWLDEVTVERHLPRLIGTASHQNMQRIIGFFFENRLLWEIEAGKNFYKQLF